VQSITESLPLLHRNLGSANQPATAGPTPRQIRDEQVRQIALEERKRLMQRSGALRPIADTMAGRKTLRSNAVSGDRAERQLLRRGGECGRASILLRKAASIDPNPESAAEKRALALRALGLAGEQPQLEFNFRDGGNFSIGYEFFDAITARLKAKGQTPCQRGEAIAMLVVIGRWIRWKSHECQKSLGGLAKYIGMGKGQAGRILQRLESVGAIKWVMRDRVKIIVVTPEGVLHAPFEERDAILAAYRADVLSPAKNGKEFCHSAV
jgi:hypothetical protein